MIDDCGFLTTKARGRKVFLPQISQIFFTTKEKKKHEGFGQ